MRWGDFSFNLALLFVRLNWLPLNHLQLCKRSCPQQHLRLTLTNFGARERKKGSASSYSQSGEGCTMVRLVGVIFFKEEGVRGNQQTHNKS